MGQARNELCGRASLSTSKGARRRGCLCPATAGTRRALTGRTPGVVISGVLRANQGSGLAAVALRQAIEQSVLQAQALGPWAWQQAASWWQ